jgi:hypothetical protein
VVTLVWAGILVVFVLVMVLVVRVQVRRSIGRDNAMLQELAPTAIRDVVDGQRVRIIGTATGGEVLKAPYSGVPCLAFHGTRSVEVSDNRDQVRTISGLPSQDVRPFTVDDGTGTVMVEVRDVQTAKLDLAVHVVTDEDVNNHVFGARMLARDTASQTYWEHILEPASKVAVIGRVSRAADGTLRMIGTVDAPVVVSNHESAFRVRDSA